MLDLSKLAQQMQGISQQLSLEVAASRQRLEQAQFLLKTMRRNQEEWLALHQSWRDRLVFTAAQPVEPLNHCPDLLAAPAAHTVLATDGSQISPSHHEIAYCYLINVGRIALHYGQNRFPLLDSLPEVFFRPEDLYISRQWGIRTEEWMGFRRTVSEAVILAELAEQMQDSASPSPPPSPSSPSPPAQWQQSVLPLSSLAQSLDPNPTLALVDGSLIYWFLDALPGEARDRILLPILQAWDRLQALHIPLVGYLSASRSSESLNFLRLAACPHNTPDCPTHCAGQGDRAPCQVLESLKDATFWATHLQPGQRSPLWRSSAKILDRYEHHAIHFCYVHVGSEIARLEFPAWVAEDPDQLNMALSLTLAQVQKGYGYPVALAEAHNQAVVRGSDRARFFALLEQQMVRTGLHNVGISYKEARKRGSIA
jgi:hypothetical protein